MHNEECKKLLKLMGIPYLDVSCSERTFRGSLLVHFNMLFDYVISTNMLFIIQIRVNLVNYCDFVLIN